MVAATDLRIPRNHWSFDARRRDLTNADELGEAIALLSGKRGGMKAVKEQIEYLGTFAGSGLINSFTGDGGLWGTTWGGQGAAGAFFSLYFLLNTIWFNRIQRYTARYLYLSNGIAYQCAYYMAVLALGQGFEYRCKDEGQNRALQDWLELRDYHEKSKRMFIEYLVQGEEFIRIFGDDFRVIDPDYIYSTHDGKDGMADRYQGILSSQWDNTDTIGYEVHTQPLFSGPSETEYVPPEQMQFRASLMFNERRGRSHFLPVFPQMFKVDQLSCVLLDTAQTQGKFAFFRKWESPQESITMLDANIQGQAPPGYSQSYVGLGNWQWQSNEAYPSGAIVDAPKGMTLDALKVGDFAQWIEPMKEAKRIIAGCVGLPAEIVGQDRSDADSYAAGIVANSWQEKIIKAKQDTWKRYDVDLISRCTGIPKADIEVTAPQIATPDRQAETALIEGAIDRRVMSRRTAMIRMDLDPDEEEKQIKKEEAADLDRQKKEAEIAGAAKGFMKNENVQDRGGKPIQ